MTGIEPTAPAEREEVGRLLLPVPCRNMHHLGDYLTAAYGEDVRMHSEGQWLIVTRP